MADKCFLAPPDFVLEPYVQLGVGYVEGAQPTTFGHHCIVRSGAIIYAGVTVGNHVRMGHDVFIRAPTRIGNHVVIGTRSVIEGNVTIGDYVKIQSLCFIPSHVVIGNRVFLGPRVTFTNDRYPLRLRSNYRPHGPTVEDDVTIGGAVTILPGVIIGRGSFVGAGAVVTKDVPPMSLVKGIPGRIFPLPEKLRERNTSLEWDCPLGEA